MYILEIIKSKLFNRPLLVILTALFIVSGLALVQAPQPAAAVIFNEPDDRIDTNPPDFVAPEGGFTWSVPPRYGLNETDDGLMDTYWRAGSFDYDPAYIYPDTWPMTFNGCQTAADAEAGASATGTYDWNINGTHITGSQCYFTYNGFTAQGTYPVTLTVTMSDTQTVFPMQEVYIRDYFIVAIGDSIASGEGNPDVRQQVVPTDPFGGWFAGNPARWQDERCHRSAYAFPSRAAINLEFADPHTSVTFINFACSGATINLPHYDPFTPVLNTAPDPSKPLGTGMLGPYRGILPTSESYYASTFIPSQLGQLQLALNPPAGKDARQFDALVVSAGGNDFHFGDIAGTCLAEDNCWPNSLVYELPGVQYNMEWLVNRALNWADNGGYAYSLPESYLALKNSIAQLYPQPAEVYITQYPDQTRKSTYGELSSNFCRMLNDIVWPLENAVIPTEAFQLSINALHGMNHAILDAAQSYGWQYVDGITSYEVDPAHPAGSPGLFVRDGNNQGHGYCASDNWIVRADESEKIQGPGPFGRLFTRGTLHPNGEGINAIADRLLHYMLPDLEATLPSNPSGDPPTFTSSFTSNGLTSQPGENGWYTDSCDSNQSCAYSRVVLQVTATGSAALEAANVYVNNLEGCSLPGVSCPTTVITPTNQLVWNFTFLNDGIYQMQFTVSDVNDQISDYVSEIKVDLHAPYSITVPEPFSVDEGSNITLTAVASDTMSAIINLDWDLDYDGIYETADEHPSFSAASLNGPTSKTVRVRATDEAGHFVITTAGINVLNVAPTPVINGAPATEEEGTEINLTSDVSDPGAADTFTYAWEVKKDGSSYKTGSAVDFDFTPDDNGAYEVSLSVTDDDGGVGTASKTIVVTNVAPVLSNVNGSSTNVNEAATFTLSGDISDPSSTDSFDLTIDWGDGSMPEEVSLPARTTEFNLDHTYADDNPTGTASDTYQITLGIEDDDGGTDTGSASVVVDNLPPSLIITAPENGALYAVNTTVSLGASLTDASALDTLSCSVTWADGASQSASLVNGLCTASHVYTAAGVYTIQLTGSDDDTGEKTESVMAVVYDPSAGFVTGGGWISSPAGAYKPDETLTGKATYGFVSKYTKGATIPTGNTAFAFDVAGMAFASQSYEWLVVNQNGTNAQFKGSGTINGMLDPNGNAYKFMLWAGDASPDTFRMRIWYEDATGEHDVYDNGVNQAIGGGNIVVHTGK